MLIPAHAGAPGRCSRSPCCTKFAGHSGFCSGPRALNDVAGAARLRQEEPEDTTDQLQRRPSGTHTLPPLPTHKLSDALLTIWSMSRHGPVVQVWGYPPFTLFFFGCERKRACGTGVCNCGQRIAILHRAQPVACSAVSFSNSHPWRGCGPYGLAVCHSKRDPIQHHCAPFAATFSFVKTIASNMLCLSGCSCCSSGGGRGPL